MPRYKITIEYDGTDYAGWQQQKDAPSVQEELQKAAFKFLAEDVVITGAGRTDAGVHALGQVAHFDTAKTLEPFKLCQAFNAHLRPQPISVLNAEIVNDSFHARFDAKKRFYIYKILNRRSRPALYVNRMWWVHQPLDVEKMQDAAQVLIGKHDFSTFRAAACQAKSPIKTLDEIRIERYGDFIFFYFGARSFLHHQVRNIVGTLKLVGEGVWTKQNVIDALNAKDRKAGGPTAAAEGLYFEKVVY
ncbi:MAG: tRNA pseudouridine(38-40) synthase TruA [Alphaproteobacteria bacterium]|nr:tRNA pseudouridine(38-40) synthase TruA [Alphaproteobacteria bacterium]MBO4643652.1 tRNA pseudouridine(38-40) synthase TruA [Alphaproteobacteria bacterium]